MITIKSLCWLGDSRDRIREFPADARFRAGFELWEIQRGHEPSDWRPMPSIGSGVNEIRVHVKGEYRVLYVAKFAAAIYVLHAFQKKTQQTAKQDIDLAKERFRGLVERRRKEGR